MKKILLTFFCFLFLSFSANAQMLFGITGGKGTTTTTFTQTITDGANSCRWTRDGGGGDFSATRIYAGQSAGGSIYDSSLLFTANASMPPKGASISTAILSINIQTITNAPTFLIFGDDIDAAIAPVDGPAGVALARTTANVVFVPVASGVIEINVKTIVEEIIARAGWNKGNMQFIVYDNGSGITNTISSASIGTYPRTLTIIYTN